MKKPEEVEDFEVTDENLSSSDDVWGTVNAIFLQKFPQKAQINNLRRFVCCDDDGRPSNEDERRWKQGRGQEKRGETEGIGAVVACQKLLHLFSYSSLPPPLPHYTHLILLFLLPRHLSLCSFFREYLCNIGFAWQKTILRNTGRQSDSKRKAKKKHLYLFY